MGCFSEAQGLGEAREPKTRRHELLVGLRAEVDPVGEATSFSLAYTNQEPFRVHMPLLQIASVMRVLRDAAETMMYRQHLALDRGTNGLLELCETSRRPAVIQILVDPISHDRMFLFQFEHDAPVSLRISAEELPFMLAQLGRAIARSCN